MPPTPVRKRECIGNLPRKQRISSVTPCQRGIIFLPQYQALYTQNSDLAGWIQIDGTNINYPVMQSKQNPDFYLKHNFEKANSPHGCPYVQANCDLQTPSDNILVYGHNMKDGTMFSDLLQYKRGILLGAAQDHPL